jgi:hypothetical protein
VTVARSNNHFITVAKDGRLMARRKGGAPVCVATAAGGLVVETDADALAAGAAACVTVRFGHGGRNREMWITEIVMEGIAVDVWEFQDRFGVTDRALGGSVRAAIERALDAVSR